MRKIRTPSQGPDSVIAKSFMSPPSIISIISSTSSIFSPVSLEGLVTVTSGPGSMASSPSEMVQSKAVAMPSALLMREGQGPPAAGETPVRRWSLCGLDAP